VKKGGDEELRLYAVTRMIASKERDTKKERKGEIDSIMRGNWRSAERRLIDICPPSTCSSSRKEKGKGALGTFTSSFSYGSGRHPRGRTVDQYLLIDPGKRKESVCLLRLSNARGLVQRGRVSMESFPLIGSMEGRCACLVTVHSGKRSWERGGAVGCPTRLWKWEEKETVTTGAPSPAEEGQLCEKEALQPLRPIRRRGRRSSPLTRRSGNRLALILEGVRDHSSPREGAKEMRDEREKIHLRCR